MKTKKLSVAKFLDPCSETGMPIYMGHQKAFLKKHCHFAEGSSSGANAARIALFGKVYRIIWLKILENNDWNNMSSFLHFLDFFTEYITKDNNLVDLIDKEKWSTSKIIKKDVFYDFFAMSNIGDKVVDYVIINYFSPAISTSEQLVLA